MKLRSLVGGYERPLAAGVRDKLENFWRVVRRGSFDELEGSFVCDEAFSIEGVLQARPDHTYAVHC